MRSAPVCLHLGSKPLFGFLLLCPVLLVMRIRCATRPRHVGSRITLISVQLLHCQADCAPGALCLGIASRRTISCSLYLATCSVPDDGFRSGFRHSFALEGRNHALS